MEKIKKFFSNIGNRILNFLDHGFSITTILIIGFVVGILLFLFQVGVIGTIFIAILNNVCNIPVAYSLVNCGYTALAIFAVSLIKGH